MSEKFKNKYRIESTRLQNWDYGWNARYFVTICTQNRRCYFGDIVDGEMKLSNVGVIANVLWYEIKNHAKNIEFGEFTVMPNHIHGILILDGDGGRRDKACLVSTPPTPTAPPPSLSLPQSTNLPPEPNNKKTIGQKRFQNQGKNTISSILGGYKSAVTKHCNRLKFDFGWQPRFHDHIIRDEASFHRISEYIINNPSNWNKDRFFK